MSKKLHSKLLAVILSLAICCATLCGSIFAAHAAAAYYNGTYSFEGGVAPYGAKQATVDVTFSLQAGFVAGEFALDNTAGNFAGIASAEITKGTRADGSAFDASAIDVSIAQSADADGQLPKVIFYGKSDDSYDVGYTSITFKLTINMTSSVAASSQYSVALADYTFTELSGTDLGIEFTGSAGSIHTHSGSLDMNSLTSESNKNFNSVYHQVDTTAKCSYCGAESYIQLYPDYNTDSSAVAAGTQPDGNIGISGITVVHNDNGNLSVNIHGCVADGYSDSYIVITDTMGKVIDTVTVSTTSPYADVILGSNAQMWSFEKLSARDINTELVITLLSHTVVSNKNTLAYSRSFNFSLADYCTKVVDENAMWPVGTSGEQKLADKNVAAGLYYYGASIEENIFNNNSSTEEFKYVDKKVLTWNGEKDTTFAGDGTIASPYIIETPEQLAGAVLTYETTFSTAGKYFEIAPNSVFNMNGMQGITLTSTASDTEKAAKNTANNWNTASSDGGGSASFAGNLNGNGVVIYNLYSSGGNCGLIPYLDTRSSNDYTCRISNISITASYIKGYHTSGGIIGTSAGDNTKADSEISIYGCSVQNSFINDADNANTNEALGKTSGALIGNISHNHIIISNCLISNNDLDATNFTGGFIGNGGWPNVAAATTIKNSIAIGNLPYPVKSDTNTNTTSNNTLQSSVSNAAYYTNVYTDQTVADTYTGISTVSTGAGAVAEMNLSSNAWFDTADYPQLRSFHDMKFKSISETQHQLVCAHKIGNTPCDVVGLTENHNFVENAEGTQKTCSACGYSQEIVSNLETVNANYAVWYGDNTKPTDTAADGTTVIINTPAELAWVALYGGTETAGKTYKVADNSVFNMNGFEGITPNSTADDVAAATPTGTLWGVNDTEDVNIVKFQGRFDGNGAIIYNIHAARLSYGSYVYNNYSGLFPQTYSSNVDISNVTVKASMFVASRAAGAIVGHANGNTYNTTINTCSVENCYFKNTDTNTVANQAAGVFVGFTTHMGITIDNCYAANNEFDNTNLKYYGGFIGSSSVYGNWLYFRNSISIGTSPSPALKNGVTHTIDGSTQNKLNVKTEWTNVYTDTATPDDSFDVAKNGITVLTNDEITGANAVENMNGLDKSSWIATNSYPQLAVFHEFDDVYVDENNHRKECVLIIDGERCETCGVNTAHTLTPNNEGTANECICGYSEEIIGNTVVPQYKHSVTWDGQTKTALTDADKDENGTYIITTAEQLAWLALGGNGTSTDGNTYKIHDDIKEIYINSGTRDLTLSQVENKLAGNNANDWGFNTWQNKDNYGFSGTFDGNGVTIYGLYHAFADDQAEGDYNGGLFPYANGDVTIKNVTIKNSYVEGWRVSGAIIGFWTGVNEGTATFDKCVVTNCYVGTRQTSDHPWTNSSSGLCGGGQSPSKYTISDCIVYGNILYSAANELCSAFVSNFNIGATYNYSVINSIAVDYIPLPASAKGGYYATKAEGISKMYSNVYTTASLSGLGYENADISSDGYIFTKTYDEMQGVGAVAAMNLGNNWFDTVDGYPELHVFHDMITATLDENNHQYVCQHFIDNVQCTVCGPVEAHTEGSCVCGYKATADDDSSINYNNITPKVWQGEIAPGFSDTTHQGTSEADAIIISTPAELAYLITISQDTSITNPTVGKYYKAADNLVFNMNGLEGINLNSSLDDVSSATPTTNNWGTKTFINTGIAYGFGGTFDGNGLIIYNLYSSAEAAGLFTVYRGGATVKNLTVKNSKLVGTNPAGGILGYHSHGETSTNATVDGCVVENCDISSISTNASWGVGSIVASTRYANHVVNNCLVVNNKITSTGSISTGIVGHVQSDTNRAKVNNCVIINSDTSRIANALVPKYTNCYTTQASPDSGLTVKTDAEMQGENTLTAMGLDESWIATNSYPQLAVFHDIVTVILDGLKHQSTCRISIGGTPCSVCTDAVAHNFEENDEHTEIYCDVCGYGYAIKGINSLNLPESVKAQLTANATYVSNFETNAKFINVYGADQPGEDEIGNEFAIYATTLNLTVNPHYVFQFAFHGDYKTNRSNIYATFTVGDDVYSTEKVETDGKLGANWANSKSAGRYHTYRFRQLPISKLCKPIAVKVYYNNNEYDFGSYSAAGFAINAIGLGADYVNHANAAKALVYYSEMLAAREAVNAQ